MYLNKRHVDIAMAKKGYKKKDLAAQCGITSQWLWKILERESCTPYTISKLTQALDVTVEYLTKEE